MTTDKLNYYKAIRSLPEDYVKEGLSLLILNDDTMFACHPDLCPIRCKLADPKWEPFEYKKTLEGDFYKGELGIPYEPKLEKLKERPSR